MISSPYRLRLLSLARTALEARVRRTARPKAPVDLNLPAAGVFVTVHCRSELRGCLGTLDAREPLAESVVRLAGDVAHKDYRFDPLSADELEHVLIDLSVLTMPAPVADPSEIVVGRDGLIVELGARRGLLLPQVAPEHGWDLETFLAHTCIKAGLDPEAWRNGASIFRFEAEVFGE